jgi:ABC-2 type transport system ATP-binding protein
MAGKDGIVYSMTVTGDGKCAQARIAAQPWVTAAAANLQIHVTDEKAAQEQLLRLALVDEDATVTEFGRKKYNLEEVFLGIVEGGNNHDNGK